MKIEVVSVDSVILYFGTIISKSNSLKVKAAYKILEKYKKEGLVEIIPSYNSILVTYDIFNFDFKSIKVFINEKLDNFKIEKNDDIEPIVIDVYYSLDVGLDLKSIAEKANLSIDEVIQIHSSKLYDVYAIGFLPGFAYLAEVDSRIKTPRLSTPRKIIPKGSVAMADSQTAIYPQNSPGGWNILGRTAFKLFDKSLSSLSPICIDSKIKFNPITKKEFLSQGGQI